METSSILRKRSERCRRLSHYSTIPALQITLRKLGDEYATLADEIEHDQIVRGLDSDAEQGVVPLAQDRSGPIR
jgi:hypothetical protein